MIKITWKGDRVKGEDIDNNMTDKVKGEDKNKEGIKWKVKIR